MFPPSRTGLAALPALLLIVTLAIPATAEPTLYQRLGGQAGVGQIVDQAVNLWLLDDRIKDDFDNINPDRLKKRLAEQICQLAHGSCACHGRAMAVAHASLNITRAKFNAVAEDLETAMERVGIPYWTQNRLMALLAPMQRDVVTR